MPRLELQVSAGRRVALVRSRASGTARTVTAEARPATAGLGRGRHVADRLRLRPRRRYGPTFQNELESREAGGEGRSASGIHASPCGTSRLGRCRARASALAVREPATPKRVATSALMTSRSAEASEKLIA